MEPSFDPVVYPKIQLGDQQFTVCFSTGAVIRLWKEHHIDLFDLATMNDKLTGAAALERTLCMLHAAISGNDGAPTLAQLGNMVQLADVPRLAPAITEAISKVAAQASAVKAEADSKPSVQ